MINIDANKDVLLNSYTTHLTTKYWLLNIAVMLMNITQT